MNRIILLLLVLLTVSVGAQTGFPKLMYLIKDRLVTVEMHEGAYWYLDWQGKRIPELDGPYDAKTTRCVYVNQSGVPINQEIYDEAEPFKGGFAVVETPNRYKRDQPRTYAAINEKGELVLPFTGNKIQNIGNGFASVMSAEKVEVFNLAGKKVTECNSCRFETNATLKNLLAMPRAYTKDSAIVRLFDFEGKELLRMPGNTIYPVTNNASTAKEIITRYLPFYQVDHLPATWVTVVSPAGKIVLDSVNRFIFNRGQAGIIKNNMGSVVDTSFRVVVPASYGYDGFMPLFGHPDSAYVAVKANKRLVVTKRNKVLINAMPVTYISYDKERQVYDLRDQTGHQWIISLQGDTIVSPVKYLHLSDYFPESDAYLVKCKPNGLMGLVNSKGKILIPCAYRKLARINKGLFVFYKEKVGGYMNANGKELITLNAPYALSPFSEGYATCGFKVKEANRYGASRHVTADGSFSVLYQLMDSTGKFVSATAVDEINAMIGGYVMVRYGTDVYMVDKNLKKVLTKEKFQLMSYFYNGTALVLDPQKNKWGLVNEKLETVLPAIYDKIDTKIEEGRKYSQSLLDEDGHSNSSGGRNFYANVIDHHLKVTLDGKEIKIELDQKQR